MVWQLPCVDGSSNGNNFSKINNGGKRSSNAFPEIVIEAAEEAGGGGTSANSLASSSLDLVPVSERLYCDEFFFLSRVVQILVPWGPNGFYIRSPSIQIYLLFNRLLSVLPGFPVVKAQNCPRSSQNPDHGIRDHFQFTCL